MTDNSDNSSEGGVYLGDFVSPDCSVKSSFSNAIDHTSTSYFPPPRDPTAFLDYSGHKSQYPIRKDLERRDSLFDTLPKFHCLYQSSEGSSDSNPYADISSLSNKLSNTHLTHHHYPQQQLLTSLDIDHILDHHYLTADDEALVAIRNRKRNNSFPHVDLNFGWMRERAENKLRSDELQQSERELAERIRVVEAFTSFSFARQRCLLSVEDADRRLRESSSWDQRARDELFLSGRRLNYEESQDDIYASQRTTYFHPPNIPIAKTSHLPRHFEHNVSYAPQDKAESSFQNISYDTPEGELRTYEEIFQDSEWEVYVPGTLELRTIFDYIFLGTALEPGEWSRIPGSWWGQHRPLFGRDWGRRALIPKIGDGDDIGPLDLISIAVAEAPTNAKLPRVMKRAWKDDKFCEARHTKPYRLSYSSPGHLTPLSSAWRTRRKVQEQHAGRWTDKTLRQDRLWEKFSWVLDVDDPRDHIWGLNAAKAGNRQEMRYASQEYIFGSWNFED